MLSLSTKEGRTIVPAKVIWESADLTPSSAKIRPQSSQAAHGVTVVYPGILIHFIGYKPQSPPPRPSPFKRLPIRGSVPFWSGFDYLRLRGPPLMLKSLVEVLWEGKETVTVGQVCRDNSSCLRSTTCRFCSLLRCGRQIDLSLSVPTELY